MDVKESRQDPIVCRADEKWCSMLESGARSVQVVSILNEADQFWICELKKVKISRGTSEEDLHIAILSANVAIVVLVVGCVTPLTFRIGDIKLLGMEDVLIEDELWVTNLSCKTHNILCLILADETLLVLCFHCVSGHFDFVRQLVVYDVHCCFLLSRDPARLLIQRFEERVHLLSDSLLALKWALVYYVCLLV